MDFVNELEMFIEFTKEVNSIFDSNNKDTIHEKEVFKLLLNYETLLCKYNLENDFIASISLNETKTKINFVTNAKTHKGNIILKAYNQFKNKNKMRCC